MKKTDNGDLVPPFLIRVFILLACLTWNVSAVSDEQIGDDTYHTPLAGEPLHTQVFGKDVTVDAKDRRKVSAWDLGVAYSPKVTDARFLPIGTVYLWRNPDEKTLFNATLSGIFNDVFYAKSLTGNGLELITTFENLTIPIDQAIYIDGERNDEEELNWGYVQLGFGLGHRQQVSPFKQDNMRSFSLLFEPGYYYFNRGNEAADTFETPDSTWEYRLHLNFRWDALQRNILELAHQGFALGGDIVVGHRNNWDDWGLSGQNNGEKHQDFGYITAFARTASEIPYLKSERHRILTSLHVGAGNDLDRFSAPQIGGSPQEDEYSSISRPIIPGALLREYFPRHYAIYTMEYRFESVFFTYIGVRSSVAWLDRIRLRGNKFEHEEDTLGSIGLRLTTGFFFKTRLQLEYNYNTGIIRDDSYGGQNALLHISRSF